MSKTVTISQSLLNNYKLKKYTSFIYGFLESNNWKVTDDANVLIISDDEPCNIFLGDYDYILLIYTFEDINAQCSYDFLYKVNADYKGIYARTNINNQDIKVDLFIKGNTILFKPNMFLTTTPESKKICSYLQNFIDEHNLNNHDLGYKLGILLSEACLSDEILRKREMNNNEHVER